MASLKLLFCFTSCAAGLCTCPGVMAVLYWALAAKADGGRRGHLLQDMMAHKYLVHIFFP